MHASEQTGISSPGGHHTISTPSTPMAQYSPFALYSNLSPHRQQSQNWAHCFWNQKKQYHNTNITRAHTPSISHPYPLIQRHSNRHCRWERKNTTVKKYGNSIFIHLWSSKNEEVQVNWHPGQENLGDYASKVMAKNTTNRSDPSAYMNRTHQDCSHGLQSPVFL